MHKALRDGKPLRYFADVWLSVLNDTVDTQADFQASKLQSNMDFTSKPGYALLEQQAEAINQTAKNALAAVGPAPAGAYQSITLPGGRWINSITLWMWHTTGANTTRLSILSWDKSAIITAFDFSLSDGYDAEYTVPFTNVYLDAGVYWISVELVSGLNVAVRYSTVDVYADGSMQGVLVGPTSDLYFKLNMQKYLPSGSFRTKRLDLLETPPAAGNFQMAYSHHQATQLNVTLDAFANATDTTPALTITNAEDGQAVPAYRYWEVLVEMASNAALDQTPQIDMLEFLYPKQSLRLCEKDKALRYVAPDILHTWQPLLSGVEYKSSDIKVIERVASGGELGATLEDTTGETIRRVISDSPLKNFRAILYLGADVPGFSEGDLLRFFTGTVQAAKYKPKYRRGFSSLSLTFKNPILELKRKVPQPASTGAVTLADISINYDGTHAIDAMLDLLRGEADIPARYINIESFDTARTSIGDASLPAAAHVVRRSNAAGLPDTRIKSPEEVGKLIGQLALLCDVYVTIDESSRITVVKHDAAATAEAAWADEDLVREGLDAVPIEDVGDIDLGYDTLLFNAALFGAEWDGSGGDWTGFSKIYAQVNSTSADEFAPGKAVFLNMMEKNHKDASKWLGPQAGYNGETIAQALSARYVARFAYPPVVMTGVVVPQSEFLRTLGSVVTVTSTEFAKLGRRGIAQSETKKFMILSKKPDRSRNRMIFNLLELT